jgi:hypothetical protein
MHIPPKGAVMSLLKLSLLNSVVASFIMDSFMENVLWQMRSCPGENPSLTKKSW